MIQDFISNSVIRYLAPKPYWTVNIDEKKPLDIRRYDMTGEIMGAKDESCLTDLSDLLRIVNAIPKQFVYNLNAERDGIVVLDVEKTCPDDLKQTLLTLPFIYGDVSMSGKGLHLIFPCPALDEVTINKTRMKEEHGYYEILIHHYVTFTGNVILPQYTNENAPISFQQIWDEQVQYQKKIVKRSIDFSYDETLLDFPQYDVLKDAILRNFTARFKKTLIDFADKQKPNGNPSRYEFAVIGSVRHSLNLMLSIPMFARLGLTENQQILLVYKIICEVLPHRAKHDESRNGQPFLLYQTYNSFATTATDVKETDN